MKDKKASALESVTCEVKSCKYHAPGDACRASNITVEAPNASNKKDTYCGTYYPQDSEKPQSYNAF